MNVSSALPASAPAAQPTGSSFPAQTAATGPSFTDFHISPRLKQQLATLGFETPTPVQAAAIPQGLAGKDVIATAQTGTGKTLAFLIPGAQLLIKEIIAAKSAGPEHRQSRQPAILVLVPTRELALQVEKQYRDLAGKFLPPSAVIIGGASEHTQIDSLRRGARVIIATPGRLEDLLDRRIVRLDKIQLLVLDEADRMLDMGFIPAIRRIVRQLPKDRQSMCFSATADPNVQHLMDEVLKNPVKLAFGSTQQTVDSVSLQAYEVPQTQKGSLLLRLVSEEPGPSLVFVGTKRRSDNVARKLEKAGLSVALLHGDRSQSQRVRALSQFGGGHARVLVATDVASRGIHVDDIAQVINYDLPKQPEDFIHRAGRTGRNGATGRAITFYTPLERRDLAAFERKLQRKIERVSIGGEALVHEDRVKPVDTSKLRLVPAQQNNNSRRRGSNHRNGGSNNSAVMLEGETLHRYSGTN